MAFGLSSFYLLFFSYVGVFVIFLPKVLFEIGYDAKDIGIIYSIVPLIRFISPFVFLKYITINNTIFRLFCALFILSGALFIYFIESFWMLIFISAIMGLSISAMLPTIENIALKAMQKERYGKVRLFGSLGFIFIAYVVAKYIDNLELVYLTYLITIVLSSILAIYILSLSSKESSKLECENGEILSREFDFKKAKYLWINIIFLQLSFGAFYNFFTLYEEAAGLDIELISYLWILGVMCEVAMLYYQGSLFKRFDLLRLIELATFLTIIRWLILYLFPDSLLLVSISQTLHAFSFALYHSATISYLFWLYDKNHLAQQFYVGFSYGLGMFLGSLISGYTYGEELFLYSSMLAFVAFVAIVAHKKSNPASLLEKRR